MSYLFDAVDDRIRTINPPSTYPAIVNVMAWIKVSGVPGGRHSVLVAYDSVNDYLHGISVRTGGSAAALYFESTWNGGVCRWRTDDDTLAFNTWYGVAATYDGSSSANDPVLYIKPEGGAIASMAVTETVSPSGSRNDSVDSLWVGGVFGSYLFQGRIVYSRMFTGSIMNSAALDDELDAAAAVAGSPYIDLPLISDQVDLSANARDGIVDSTSPTLSGDNPTLLGGGGGSSKPFYYRSLYGLN
jgi:hypothetical protein